MSKTVEGATTRRNERIHERIQQLDHQRDHQRGQHHHPKLCWDRLATFVPWQHPRRRLPRHQQPP